nr:DUF4339 domain-containing protein [Xanthomonas translucens]
MHEEPTLSAWYYADAARDRHGPLSTAALLERLRDGLLDRDTLVWREGLPDWRPLHTLADELGLPATATPPPRCRRQRARRPPSRPRPLPPRRATACPAAASARSSRSWSARCC